MSCLHSLFKNVLVLRKIFTNLFSFLVLSLNIFYLKIIKRCLCLQDWSYRDIVPPVQTYSQKQRDYFGTPPARRVDLLESWGFLAKEKDQAVESPDSNHHFNAHG